MKAKIVATAGVAILLTSMFIPTASVRVTASTQTADQTVKPNPASTPAALPTQTPTPQPTATPALNLAQDGKFSVEVLRVVAFSTPEAPALLIEYKYEFKDLERVYIKGVGLVAPQGQQKYLTYENQLEFRRSVNGPVIQTVPLSETLILQAKPSVNIPEDKEFTEAAREEVWSSADNARRILNNLFPSGYSTKEENGIITYKTTYANLTGLSEGLQGEVAVAISHPFSSGNGATLFRIRYTAHESRTHSPKWRTPGAEVKSAAENYVTQVMNQIKGGGR